MVAKEEAPNISATVKEILPIPNHVAIIMDGNGRWAKQRGLPRMAGHRAGTENIRRIIKIFAELHVKYLTLYAFSTENWSRPQDEVRGLFRLMGRVVRRETESLHKEGVRLRHLGKLDGLSQRLQNSVRGALELTKNNTKITVNIAFNYGGRAEILDAIKQMLADGVKSEEVDETLLTGYLHTAGLPDPDLIIRTAGEMRLSNFLIWQSAYSEYYSTPTYWPDFDESDIEKALIAYSQRQRRFGGLEAEEKT